VALLDLCNMHDSALPRLRVQVTAYLTRAEVSGNRAATTTATTPTPTTAAQE